ncbi:tyrosinase 2 [Apiospora hydei]|uniref:Tyrosinase 2 n=1 Tax=Apiospora hydei TaxID=1337664 RepID=A0ABR1WRC7_9PEZI
MSLASIAIPAVAQGQPVPVIGLATGVNLLTGERPARKNINDLQAAGGPAWDLYILGLSEMQNASESDPLSYFQIAGIHGRPFIPWNGVENTTAAPFNGFCPHGNTPFTAWHRPFMALYEQTLGDHVQVLASQYNDSSSAAYKAAAESFRAPFWDWAADYRLPASVMEQLITVNGPHGTVDIPNPLYSYRWQQFPLSSDPNYFPEDGRTDCYGWNETKRQPDSNGKDQYNIVNGNLAGIAGLKDAVYRVFTAAKAYETMASTEDQGPSFENLHNDVHQAISTIMAWSDYSAFDPIFFLHHANVDRLFAMWQAINYNNTYQTQSRAMGELFHTGKTVAAMATFGYTYPEIDDWSLSREGTRKAVITQVNQLYGNGANGTSSSAQQRRGGRANRSLRLRHRQQQQQQQQQDHATKEYFAQISVERAELQLPCTIFVMLGDDKAGQMSLLSMPMSGTTHAEVPLTRALGRVLASDTAAAPATSAASAIKNNALISDAKFVASTLSQLFRVEIRKADGSTIPVDSVPSLSIQVESRDVVAASRIEEFPKYGAATRLPGVGLGKLARRDADTRLR